MPGPHAVDLGIGRIGLRELQLRGLFDFDAVDAAAQRDLRRPAAAIAAVDADRRAEVEIRHRRRLEVGDIHAGELDFQVGGEGPHELLPERLGLAREVVAGREEGGQAAGVFGELFEQRTVDVVADADAEDARVARALLDLLQQGLRAPVARSGRR